MKRKLLPFTALTLFSIPESALPATAISRGLDKIKSVEQEMRLKSIALLSVIKRMGPFEEGVSVEKVKLTGEGCSIYESMDTGLLQEGGTMTEVPGDGADNDSNCLQYENVDALSGYNITCVLYDSGNLKDDVFDLSVSGYGRLGSTPAGGLRKFGLNIAPGNYTATLTVVATPDNVGTLTLLILENGITVGSLICTGSCPEGPGLSVTFTVTGE